jgi:hypothetical protein
LVWPLRLWPDTWFVSASAQATEPGTARTLHYKFRIQAGAVVRTLLITLLLFTFSPALHAYDKEKALFIFANIVYRINPGMDAVLELTSNQYDTIWTAHVAYINDEQVDATRQIAQRNNENSAEADADAYRSAVKAARQKYDEVLSQSLVEEQKHIVESLNRIGREVEKEATDHSGEEWTAKKAEHFRRVKELGAARLDEVLTPAKIQLLGID